MQKIQFWTKELGHLQGGSQHTLIERSLYYGSKRNLKKGKKGTHLHTGVALIVRIKFERFLCTSSVGGGGGEVR